MLNERFGTTETIGGVEFRRTRIGDQGHAVFGPYEPLFAGQYGIAFTLALGSGDVVDPDAVCVVLDIAAAGGMAELARREVTARELSQPPTVFSLPVSLHEYRKVEYRIWVAGTCELLLGPVPTASVSDAIASPQPPAGPQTFTADPVELHRQVRAVLRKLEPCGLIGVSKARYGHAGDGGYVCIDDFAGIDTALSFGINDDISWDLAVVEKGLTIYQFDHTVNDPAPSDSRMVFKKTMIDAKSGPDTESLGDLIDRHDKRRRRPNMILKTDIEGAEWPMLQATSDEQLSRLAWIVGEFHYFQGLADHHYRRMIDSCLSRLAPLFGVVHVHGNIGGGITNIANVVIPCVLELTLANRGCYDLGPTDELFPGPLDVCCDPQQPDMFLGAFRY